MIAMLVLMKIIYRNIYDTRKYIFELYIYIYNIYIYIYIYIFIYIYIYLYIYIYIYIYIFIILKTTDTKMFLIGIKKNLN